MKPRMQPKNPLCIILGLFILEAHNKLIGPREHPKDLTYSVEDHLGAINIYDSSWNLQIYFY